MKSALYTIILITLLISGCNDNEVTNHDPVLTGDEDPGYRVLVYPNPSEPMLPSHNEHWQVTFKYRVQPLPQSGWSADSKTVYTYGQIDFDMYGLNGNYRISDYQYNQLVPQTMIGNCLDSNDSQYNPSWSIYTDWVIQAQYYWLSSAGVSRALCGNVVHVVPDDVITTDMYYSDSTGKITLTISAPEGTSSVVIDKPFPNDSLFTDWKSFFAAAENASSTHGPYGNSALNVESHYVDQETLCSILPFRIRHVEIPNVEWQPQNYTVSRSGNYDCHDSLSNKLAILDF